MNSITRRGGALKVVIIIVVILVLLVALAIGGIVGLFVWGAGKIDQGIKLGIEQGGTYALGVPVTVSQVDLAITKGTFEMDGFNVANPAGYDTAHFVDLGSGFLQVDYQSMQQSQGQAITLPELRLSAIDLNLEKESGKANYQVILDNLKKFEDKGSKTPSTGGDEFQFVITKVIIEDIAVHADVLPIGGEATMANAEIDEIVLNDVGSDNPVDMGELIAIVTKAILGSVAQGLVDLPGDIAGELGTGLGDLSDLGDMGIGVAADIGGKVIGVAGDITEQATEAVEELEGAAKDIGESIEDATKGIEDAAEGIGDLLGGSDDKKDKK